MSAAAMVENIIFCIVILKNELFVQSLLFHFQASPDERTNALGIVVADWLAHVVVEAAIALIVWLLDVWTRARTETTYRAALGKTDGLVWVHLDELVQDSVVSLYTGITVFL